MSVALVTTVRSLGLRAAGLLGLALAAGPARADDVEVHLTKEQALESVFPASDHVVELRHVLSPAEIRRVEQCAGARLEEGGFYLYAGLRSGRINGYAAIVSQIGKVKPITHIVGVTPDGRVGTVAVMIYRESHGDEVAAPRFMAQYRGLSLDDPIRVDRDIIHVAGATLSGHAICRGVRKALAVVRTVFLERAEADRSALLVQATDVTPPALRVLDAAVPAWPGGAEHVEPPSVLHEAGATGLRAERRVMGTVCTIEAWTDAGDETANLRDAVEAALDEVSRWDGVLSDWRADTPLARLNAAPVGTQVAVGPDLRAWLADAEHWWRATGGAFDPTVGALVRTWGLRSGAPARPSDALLETALRASRWTSLGFDAGHDHVSRLQALTTLDPGASGKGWALDRAADLLRSRGLARALLSFRSTILALGPPPGRRAWVVPVVHDEDGSEVVVVELLSGSLSVSCGALSAFDDRGVLRGHVVDPLTGVPVEAARLAWVQHASAAASDALATALLVQGATLPPVDDARGGFLLRPGLTPTAWPVEP